MGSSGINTDYTSKYTTMPQSTTEHTSKDKTAAPSTTDYMSKYTKIPPPIKEYTSIDATAVTSTTECTSIEKSSEITDFIFYETAIKITEYGKAFTSTVYT